MARPRMSLTLIAVAAATSAQAQVQTTINATERIVITGRSLPQVSGFAAATLSLSPLQASTLNASELADAGATSLAGVARLDASVSDAYNTEGYWSTLSIRGFVLDNRSNFRRDGLPINAETAIGLANKERVEVLKGISGVQAGVSAPGGLVNLVVKRPGARTRDASLQLQQGGTLIASVDFAERFGEGQALGLRLNAQTAELRPQVRDAEGSRRLLALAGDWQLTADSRLEAEFETSHQRQPSVPGFSLRGNALPDAAAIDPRLNLNNQPWSQPVVLDGDTASLRWRQRLSADWQFTAHGATQRLRSDDRIAFPFGCYDATADVYYADRYCPDGSFDLYDFRSDNERRRTDALDLQVSGSARTGRLGHEISAGVLNSRRNDHFQRQAYNYTGSGLDDGSVATSPAPDLTDENTNRRERSTEFYLRNMVTVTPQWSVWGGLRHTRLDRKSVRTDGSRATAYKQAFTTPWLGVTWRATDAAMLYASWGQGIETDVAPNRARYVNAGQALPALKSRQSEAGIKYDSKGLEASIAAFVITRPLAADIGSCDEDRSCERLIDGAIRHQGVEGSMGKRWGAWSVQGTALWIDAKRHGASDASSNGLAPTNVPKHAMKARFAYDLASVPGLQLQGSLVHEGPRVVVPDNSVEASRWTRLDIGARWRTRVAGAALEWRIAVDNVTDTRAWRETPYQFGHAYLFPLAPRSWRASVQTSF